MKLWSSLLFLHGHVADPALARSLAGEDVAETARGERDLPSPAPTARRASQRPCVPFRRGAIAAVCSVALSPFR